MSIAEDQFRAHKQASEDMEDIRALKQIPALERYLKRRLREILARHEQTTLTDDSLSDADVLRERHACKVLRNEVVGFVETDEQNHRITLGNALQAADPA